MLEPSVIEPPSEKLVPGGPELVNTTEPGLSTTSISVSVGSLWLVSVTLGAVIFTVRLLLPLTLYLATCVAPVQVRLALAQLKTPGASDRHRRAGPGARRERDRAKVEILKPGQDQRLHHIRVDLRYLRGRVCRPRAGQSADQNGDEPRSAALRRTHLIPLSI